MSMSIECPHCAVKIKLKDDRYVGKKVACPSCKTPFVVELPDEEVPEEMPVEDEDFGVEDEPPALLKKRSKKSGKSRPEPQPRPERAKLPPAVLIGGGFGGTVLVGLLLWWLLAPGQPPVEQPPNVAAVETPPVVPVNQPAPVEKPPMTVQAEPPVELPMPEPEPEPVSQRPAKHLSQLMLDTYLQQAAISIKKARPEMTDAQVQELINSQVEGALDRMRKEDPDFLCLTAADEKLLADNQPLPHSQRRIEFTAKKAREINAEYLQGINSLKDYESGVEMTPPQLELLAMSMDRIWKRMCEREGWNAPDKQEELRKLEEERLGMPVSVADLKADARRREQAQADLPDDEKLKLIVLAMHSYHDTYIHFPGASQGLPDDRGGKAGLSWRVHLLQMLDGDSPDIRRLLQVSLDDPDDRISFKDFQRDEPWDSPHNRPLLDRMPNIYRFKHSSGNRTTVHLTVDPESVFGQNRLPATRQVTAGTSNTFLGVLGGKETAVEWTKPGGLELGGAQSLAEVLGTPPQGGYRVMLFDGSVRRVAADVDLADFRDAFAMENKTGKPRDLERLLQPR